jgi:hypothetical protein
MSSTTTMKLIIFHALAISVHRSQMQHQTSKRNVVCGIALTSKIQKASTTKVHGKSNTFTTFSFIQPEKEKKNSTTTCHPREERQRPGNEKRNYSSNEIAPRKRRVQTLTVLEGKKERLVHQISLKGREKQGEEKLRANRDESSG